MRLLRHGGRHLHDSRLPRDGGSTRWQTITVFLVCGSFTASHRCFLAGVARHTVRELELACRVSSGQWRKGGALHRRCNWSRSPAPRDDVIPAQPRCRDESELFQEMGHSAFVDTTPRPQVPQLWMRSSSPICEAFASELRPDCCVQRDATLRLGEASLIAGSSPSSLTLP